MDNIQDNIIPASHSTQKNIPLDVLINYSNQGLSYSEIGKLVGCSKNNIYQRFATVGFSPEHLAAYKKSKADLLAFKQREILLSLDSDEIKKMAPRDKILSYGILYDKERLERGQSTSINGYEGIGDDGLSAKVAGILQRAAKVGIRITEIVGELPQELRSELSKLLPQSHDDTGIIEDECK